MSKKLIHLTSFALIMGLVLSSVAGAADLNLVAWWKFDDGSGIIAKDSSGKGNNGTLNGNAQWVQGQIGGALQFNGTNAFVRAPHIPLNSQTFTITMWVNPILYTSEQVVFSQTQSRSTNLSIHFRIYGPNSGRIRMGFYSNDLDTTGNTIVQNNWYHIAFWYNFENQIRRIYVNGAQAAQGAATPFLGTTGNTVIGSWDGTGQWFSGIIDDVRIYKRALTIEEIKQVMIGIPPGVASDPSPADEEIDVPRDVVLSWTPGEFAPPVSGHKIYLSDKFTDVNDGIGGVTRDANSYTPTNRLNLSTTYYWRVDEVNGPPDYTIYKGDVWSFTTELFAYPIQNIIATASSSTADRTPENTVNGSGLEKSGLLHDAVGDNHMWLSSVTGPQPTWIQYEFDKVYKLHEMWVWNSNETMEPVIGFGFKDVTIEYSVNGIDYTTLGTTHQFARAPGMPGYEHNTTIDFGGLGAKYVKLTVNSNWGGILKQYGLSEVRFLYIPVQARDPYPQSGATGVNPDVVLSWKAGREAAKHNVYVSTDEQAVIGGTAPVATVTVPSYSPPSLNLGVTHYWRVDEVNEAEIPTTWPSNIWTFTTSDHIVVDNFESYNDLDTTDPKSNRIFNAWIDGYGTATNGSIVGYENPPFAEKTIVHGGKQSMPFSYSNTAGKTYSEAERTFAVPQNWTQSGVKSLALFFCGVSGNTGQLYVKINGTKVTYDGDASNLALTGWQPWNIDLASVGVSLQRITKLAVGIDGNGAAGKLYFDDIRLYPYTPVLLTPSAPDDTRLIGHWKFDGNAQDSSGKNNHGTLGGNPTFVAGKVGTNAINLDGSDYVAIDGLVNDITSTNITLSVWVKTTQSTEGNVIAANDSTSGHPLMIGISGGSPYVNDGGDTRFPPPINDNQWHLLTYVRNGSTGYIYVDGVQRGTYTSGFSLSTVTRWSIGQEWDNVTPSDFYTGVVDDARIYNYSLSEGEVGWLSGRTKPYDKPF